MVLFTWMSKLIKINSVINSAGITITQIKARSNFLLLINLLESLRLNLTQAK